MKRLWLAVLMTAIVVQLGMAQQKTLTIWLSESETYYKDVVTAYQASHPDVKITMVFKASDFNSYRDEQKLAMDSGTGPDLCYVNQTPAQMGAFADQGLVIPLDGYAARYGWYKNVGASILAPNHWDTATHSLGTGKLYAVSPMVEFGCVYYNKDLFKKAGIAKLPATWDELDAASATLKKAGITPIVTGNVGTDSWTSIHITQAFIYRYMTRSQIDGYIFAKKSASFNLPEVVKGAKMLQDWVRKGYFNEGYAGVSWNDSERLFISGKGAMFIAGNWAGQDFVNLTKEIPCNWDVFKVPSPFIFGGPSTSIGVAKSCKYPDVAADVLNALVTDYKVKARYNQFPIDVSGLLADKTIEAPAQIKNMLKIYAQIAREDGEGYYGDWPTPTMYDTIAPYSQKLVNLQTTPEEFAKAVDKDLQAFLAEKYK
jgi:raffinose/stachyose/melibiose transport system substrate-binding protein